MFHNHEHEATLQILYQTEIYALFYNAEKTYEVTLKKWAKYLSVENWNRVWKHFICKITLTSGKE